MPSRPPRPCVQSGCAALTYDGRCALHRRDTSDYDRHRGSAHDRGYGADWRRLRARVLAEEPLCRHCLRDGRVTAATDVDHITAKARGGTDDRANLQPLCHQCHSRKTATEDMPR